MDKTAHTELHRLFLIDKLPEPLSPASSHLQLFDNYIPNTRIRLRKIRDPYSKAWTRVLQQRSSGSDGTRAITKLAEIYLNEQEYAVFERFEGREVRKNRYFHEFDLVTYAFDLYLGDLWGLHTARVDFGTIGEMDEFEPPSFAVYELTNDPLFEGSNLVGRSFDEIRQELARLEPLGVDMFETAAE